MKTAIGSGVNLEQYDPLLTKALAATQKLLTEGEKHLGVAVQQKPVWNFLPHSIIVTNKRVILHKPRMFKTTFHDFLWRDIKKVHLTDRLFGSELVFEYTGGYLVSSFLPKNQAKKVYAIAQAKEEEWVEKWRLRKIEEERARSGANHIVLNKEGQSSSGVDGKRISIKERLLELDQLRSEGLITQDEYQNKKMEILELI
jgi:hypothetical protein